MQNMWISIVLIVLVIVVGLIAGTRLSAPGPQRRAVYSAFGTLAVLAIWFFLFVTFFPGEWIVPFFTVACIVVPICIYMGVARGGKKKKVRSAGKAFEIPKKVVTSETTKPTKQTAATASKQAPTAAPAPKASTPEKAPQTPAATSAQSTAKAAKTTAQAKQETPKAAKAASNKQAQATPAAKPAKPPVKKQVSESPAKEQESKPTTSAASQDQAPTPIPTAPTAPAVPASESQPETKQQPAAAQEKQQDIKEAEERIFEKPLGEPAAPAPETVDPNISAAADIDILVNKTVAEELDELEELVKPFNSSVTESLPVDQGPDLNVGAPVSASDESALESSSEPEKASNATAPSVTPATNVQKSASATSSPVSTPAAPEPTPAPKDPFEEFSERAAALRDQGAYAIAAMLYEEAAALAPTANDMRSTQFDELACYVKAGDTNKAKALASKLRQSSVLTRFERIKLDAVERMG